MSDVCQCGGAQRIAELERELKRAQVCAPEAVILEMQEAIYRYKDLVNEADIEVIKANDALYAAKRKRSYHTSRLRQTAEFLTDVCDTDYMHHVKDFAAFEEGATQ